MLVPFTREFLDCSWNWLRDEETRYLTMTPEFTREDQGRFFDSLGERPDYRIWGVILQGAGPIGAAGLKNIGDENAEYWGYIGEKAWWGRGFGAQMVNAVEGEARKLGLKQLYLTVGRENVRAVRLYRRLGYRESNTSSSRLIMEKTLDEVSVEPA